MLEETGVWCIEHEDAFAAEAYLAARKAFLLEEHRLDADHWLRHMLKTVEPEQVQVRHGAILHSENYPPLAECIELVLVDTLEVSLEREAGGYSVSALRHDDTLYLTSNAGAVTELVSDYVFDDRYDEGREDEDAQTLATFIAVGCSQLPGEVVKALLPYALRHGAHSKLSGAVVQLIFDSDGKLKEVISA